VVIKVSRVSFNSRYGNNTAPFSYKILKEYSRRIAVIHVGGPRLSRLWLKKHIKTSISVRASRVLQVLKQNKAE
jgi:hypothetical protein